MQFHPAVGFALPVVRKPAPTIYTCLGGGYMASGAIGKDKEPEIWRPDGAKLLALEGAGEVQTPIFYNGEERVEIGDCILFRHSKAGELCERFPFLYRVKRRDYWEVFNISGMANAFYKGTKWRNWTGM